jgi:diadenosine tetraphosphate (Ap4A) HIT family hydrolase
MPYDPNNIFAKILDGSIPSSPVLETEMSLAFSDINPRAPVHDLVIPRGAYTDLTEFAEKASDAELADWVRSLAAVAKKGGITESGYRIIVNCGSDGHQEVPHLHGHVLGGRPLGGMIKAPD